MSHRVVVVEGEMDRRLWHRLLEAEPDVDVRGGHGRSSMIALAESILRVDPDSHVAVIMDSDHGDPDEERRLVSYLLSSAAASSRWRLVVISPEVEALLFRDTAILAPIVGDARTITDDEYVSQAPKLALGVLLKRAGIDPLRPETWISRLNLDPLRNAPEVVELLHFLDAAQHTTTFALAQ